MAKATTKTEPAAIVVGGTDTPMFAAEGEATIGDVILWLNQVGARVIVLENQNLNDRLTAAEGKLDTFESWAANIDTTVDGFENRITTAETTIGAHSTDLAAVDASAVSGIKAVIRDMKTRINIFTRGSSGDRLFHLHGEYAPNPALIPDEVYQD